MSIAITLAGLHRTYGSGPTAVHALRGLDLEIEAGDLVSLTGPSGSGKTTLLNCLLGLDQPDGGVVDVFDERVTDMSYEQAVAWRRRNVAIVFQTTGLLPHLTARENLDVVLRMREVSRTDRQERVRDAFERMRILDFADHRPDQLSGGQRQRVSLARAIATRPRLLVADEPTGELDTDTTVLVLEQLRAVAEATGATMLLATHDQDVEAVADRTVHLVDGKLVHP